MENSGQSVWKKFSVEKVLVRNVGFITIQGNQWKLQPRRVTWWEPHHRKTYVQETDWKGRETEGARPEWWKRKWRIIFRTERHSGNRIHRTWQLTDSRRRGMSYRQDVGRLYQNTKLRRNYQRSLRKRVWFLLGHTWSEARISYSVQQGIWNTDWSVRKGTGVSWRFGSH